MLFTDKYAPKKIDDIIGNDQVKNRVRQWILNWLAGKRQRPLLLAGHSGIGKTALAYAAAKEFDLDLIEMNASELRNKARIEKVLHGAMMAGSLTGAGKLILIDDVDTLQGRKDFGGAGAIAKVLKECACPIILTTGDAWNKKISTIRSESEVLSLKRVSKPSLQKLLSRIAEAEGIGAGLVENVVEDSAGDVRSAINDLQAGIPGARDREKDIFNQVRVIFKSSEYQEVREVTKGDFDYDIVKLWVDENIPNEYEKYDDLAAAYNWLSRADIFEGRIRKSYWKYLKYAIDLSTAGVSLAKAEVYRKFTKYAFPEYLKTMSRTIVRRAILKKIGLKIGARVHANRRDALEYMSLLREQGKNYPDDIAGYYDLEEDELAFILETSPRKVSKRK
jgi:replication factor C large subunit